MIITISKEAPGGPTAMLADTAAWARRTAAREKLSASNVKMVTIVPATRTRRP
jgi:hypothetical protein